MAWHNERVMDWHNARVENIESIEYIEKEKYYQEITKLVTAIGHLQEDAERFNQELDCEAMRLRVIENKLVDLAHKSTMKRRRVTVRAGNQVVEVVRNG